MFSFPAMYKQKTFILCLSLTFQNNFLCSISAFEGSWKGWFCTFCVAHMKLSPSKYTQWENSVSTVKPWSRWRQCVSSSLSNPYLIQNVANPTYLELLLYTKETSTSSLVWRMWRSTGMMCWRLFHSMLKSGSFQPNYCREAISVVTVFTLQWICLRGRRNKLFFFNAANRFYHCYNLINSQ